MALFLLFVLRVVQFDNQTLLDTALGDGSDPQSAVGRLVGFLNHIFEILQSTHRLVVDHQDDESLSDTGILHLSVAQGGHFESVRQVQLSLGFFAQRFESGTKLVDVEFLECLGVTLCVAERYGFVVRLLVSYVSDLRIRSPGRCLANSSCNSAILVIFLPSMAVMTSPFTKFSSAAVEFGSMPFT